MRTVAFLEGQKSVTSDLDLLVSFELIKSLTADSDLSAEGLRARVKLIVDKAKLISEKLEAAKSANIRDRIFGKRPDNAKGKLRWIKQMSSPV